MPRYLQGLYPLKDSPYDPGLGGVGLPLIFAVKFTNW